jgi:hypothetical protein
MAIPTPIELIAGELRYMYLAVERMAVESDNYRVKHLQREIEAALHTAEVIANA